MKQQKKEDLLHHFWRRHVFDTRFFIILSLIFFLFFCREIYYQIYLPIWLNPDFWDDSDKVFMTFFEHLVRTFVRFGYLIRLIILLPYGFIKEFGFWIFFDEILWKVTYAIYIRLLIFFIIEGYGLYNDFKYLKNKKKRK